VEGVVVVVGVAMVAVAEVVEEDMEGVVMEGTKEEAGRTS